LYLRYAGAADICALTNDVAGMSVQIPEILCWAISETVNPRGGLTSPYMTSPYRWAYVDRWFDPEMPERIMDDNKLCHRASNLEASVMARYRQPKTSSS